MKSKNVININNKLVDFTKYRVACSLIYQTTDNIRAVTDEIFDLLLELLAKVETADSNMQFVKAVERISEKCNKINDICFDTVTRTGLLHGFTESDIDEIAAETITKLKAEGHIEFNDEVFRQTNIVTEKKIKTEIDKNIISLKRK